MQKEPSRKKLLATHSKVNLPANSPVALVGHRCVAEMEQWLDGDALKVTSIRDPLDVYVSLYNYWHTWGINGDRVRGDAIRVDGREVGFDHWLTEKLVGNMYCRFFYRYKYGYLTPGQSLEITDEVIEKAIEVAQSFDLIYDVTSRKLADKYEDFARLKQMIGFEGETAAPRENVSLKKFSIASQAEREYLESLLRAKFPADYAVYEEIEKLVIQTKQDAFPCKLG